MRSRVKKPINIIVGDNIRFYREKVGYSREKFAELLGITARFLADAETGYVGVSLTNLKHICELLGISADRLLWGSNNSLGLDEKVSHLDKKYLPAVEEVIQKQLEVIAIAAKEERLRKTRN